MSSKWGKIKSVLKKILVFGVVFLALIGVERSFYYYHTPVRQAFSTELSGFVYNGRMAKIPVHISLKGDLIYFLFHNDCDAVQAEVNIYDIENELLFQQELYSVAVEDGYFNGKISNTEPSVLFAMPIHYEKGKTVEITEILLGIPAELLQVNFEEKSEEVVLVIAAMDQEKSAKSIMGEMSGSSQQVKEWIEKYLISWNSSNP